MNVKRYSVEIGRGAGGEDRLSIIEVSKIAGVSTATVSRVINNRARVSPATAEAVRRAINQLGYVPPSPDRRVRLNSRSAWPTGVRLGRVALLFPDPSAEAMKTVLSGRLSHGINEELSRHGLMFVVAGLADWNVMPTCIRHGEVDGLIVRGTVPLEHLYPLMRALPCVTALETRSIPSCGDQVLEDNSAVSELAARYLQKQGCERVAVINRDPLHPAYSARMHAFSNAALIRGMNVECINLAAPFAELVDRMLAVSQRPDGVFVAGNDTDVAGVYSAMVDRGIDVGQEMEFISVGFDAAKITGLNRCLSYIDINPETIGRTAAEVLLWRLRHPSAPRRRVLVEPKLIESTYSNRPETASDRYIA